MPVASGGHERTRKIGALPLRACADWSRTRPGVRHERTDAARGGASLSLARLVQRRILVSADSASEVRMIHRKALSIVLVSIVACTGGAGRMGEPLTHQLEDVDEHVDALRVELGDHRASAQAATSLTVLQALEITHGAAMDDHMDMLGHAIDDMQMCGDALAGDVDSMMEMMDGCTSEVDRHARAIAAAVDLDTAVSEEERHHAAMMERLDELDEHGAEMMDGYGMMMCNGHHGIDDDHES